MTKLSKVACFSSLMYRYTSRLIVIYLNIWTEHLQSYLSSRKVLSSQTIFFIKFEIFLIKGIVIWKFGADKLFEFSFRKKNPSKINLIIMSDIPFRNKQTQLKEHFKFYILCLLKSCLVLRCINSEFIDTETTTLIQILHVSQVKWETFHNFRVL